MLEFWIFSAALALASMLFVCYPVFVSKPQHTLDAADEVARRKKQNVRIFKERLAEIGDDLSEGRCDQAAYNDQKQELELALLADVVVAEGAVQENGEGSGNDHQHKSISSLRGKLASLILAAMVALAGYGLYFNLGAFDQQEQFQTMRFAPDELQRAQNSAENRDINAIISQLYEKLKNSPDNIDGWMLLSRSAMNIENYSLAAEGYAIVIAGLEKVGQDASKAYGLLAQAYYFDGEGKLSARVEKTLDQAFAIDTNESNSLGLLAIHAFESEHYVEAATLWERLLAATPDHPARASIEAGISRAKGFAGIASEAPSPASLPVSENVSETQANEAEIIVRVDISPELKARSHANDTVFIFARSESGPPMPLAASRHSVSALPLTVVLNDQMAMGPMAKLSQVNTVNVVARVSKSGQPIAQTGDFQGRATEVSVFGAESVDIVITEEL